MNFNIIKRNFDIGLWTSPMVALAVQRGIITAEQYKEITSQTYKQ